MLRIDAICLCGLVLGCSGANGETTNFSASASGGQHSETAGMNTGGGAQHSGGGGTAGNGQSLAQGGAAQGGTSQAGAGQSSQPNCGPGCFPLCQGGVCQCECSAIEGCDSAGWQVHTIGWDKFAHPDLTGGVELCMPDEWAPIEAGGAAFSNGQFSFNVYAEVRLDHADALQRLSEMDQAQCTAQDYGFNFVRAGSLPDQQWPALMQRYKEMPPACGACPNPVPASELNVVANVSIAFGEYVLQTRASAPEGMGPLDQVIEIGRTARTQTELTPIEAGTEIGDLSAQHNTQCPQ